MIGRTISHYKIVSKIGEGGMGVVYKAEDTKLKRSVALKFLPADLTRDPGVRQRFVHEARTASALDHSSICTIYEIDETDDGQMFIVMGYYPGETLKTKIGRGPLPVDEALRITVHIAEGLDRAHDAGITHRDIKPANVIITNRGEAKILDFGLAKLAGQTKLTRTGTTVGTVAYMSPEQARGDEVDHRADIWSLGIVLYEMLTGRLPFKGDYEHAVIYSILNEEPEPVDTIRPEVPSSIQRVIECTLKKDPRDRYPNISGLMSDLRNLTEGSGIRGARHPRRPRAKHIALAASLAAVVVVIASVLPHLWQRVGPTEPRTLAVVDFDNIGGEEASHLAFGLAEGICVKLSKVTGIRVVSSDDIRRLRNDNLAARDVADRLGAEYAVGGALLKSGSKIRVTPQLIEASTGNIVWSELFDREFTDVFDFLDEASLKIAEALRVELSPADRVALKEEATGNPEAYDHYLKGRHHYDRVTVGDNELAVKEFKSALKNDPSYPLALAGLADAYVQRYKERFDYDEYWLDQADSLIARTLELDPDLAEAYESRAEVLLEKENLLAALDAAEKARSLRPDWDEPYVRLGEIHKIRGEGSLALEMFERALAIRPSVGALCGRGSVFYTRGDHDSAEAPFRAAIEHHPNHERPYRELAEVYWDLKGDLEEAERMYRRAIEVRPDYAASYVNLSWLLYGKLGPKEAADLVRGFVEKYPYNYQAYEAAFWILEGMYWPAAVAVAEEAVARNPDRVWPHLLLASSYSWQMAPTDQPEKAVEAVERAMALRPGSSRVLQQAGEIYRGLGKPKKALELFRRALELNPGSAGILSSMAGFLLDEARYDSAASVAARAIEQAPGVITIRGVGDSYLMLGEALSLLMRSEEFLRVLENAAEKYGRDDPSFYAVLGREQCLAGQFQEAISTYRHFLDVKRRNYGWMGLGMAEWLAGDTESALESLRRAAEETRTAQFGPYCEERLIDLLKYLERFDEIEELLKRIHARGQFWTLVGYYSSMRRFDDALAAATEYLGSGNATDTARVVLEMAAWHRQRGNLEESRKLLDEVPVSLPAAYQPWVDFDRAVTGAIVGDLVSAEMLARNAVERSSAYPWSQDFYLTFLGRLQYAMGQTQEALETLARMNGRYVKAALPGLYHGAQLGMVSGTGSASHDLAKALFFATRNARGGASLNAPLAEGRCYAALASARLGNEERAREEIAYALRLEPERADVAYLAACTYSLIGDTETALGWLKTSVDRGHQELWWARVDPDLDNLRQLARFQEILDQWDRHLHSMWHEAESSK